MSLVKNGSFGTGLFPPWIDSGTTLNTIIIGGGYNGLNYYRAGPDIAYLSQIIDTLIGVKYIISYSLQNMGGGPIQYFSTSINGISIPNSIISLQSNGLTPSNIYDSYILPTTWINYSFYFTATSSLTTLTFTTEHETSSPPYPPPINVYFNLTNISIIEYIPIIAPLGIKVSGKYISVDNNIYQLVDGNIILYSANVQQIGGLQETNGVYVTNTLAGTINLINYTNKKILNGQLFRIGSIGADVCGNFFYTIGNSSGLNDIFILYNKTGIKIKLLTNQPINIQIFYFNRYLKVVNLDSGNIDIYNVQIQTGLINLLYTINTTIYGNIIYVINTDNTMILYLDDNMIYVLNNNKLEKLNITLIRTYNAIALVNYKLYGITRTFINNIINFTATFLLSL